MKLYNSLTKKLENFEPINKGKVGMYVCGPTVYERPHIGNARSAVVYDLLYRVLIFLYGKENITFVRNITDVDDKIINSAKLHNRTPKEITTDITEAFHQDMSYLLCEKPNIEPRATEHIAEMITMIEQLIINNYAYATDDGHVFFRVKNYSAYTKLSGRSISEMLSGYRIENEAAKEDMADFVLWKPAPADEVNICSYDSPWGKGRPGWHIECSAMSTKYLGHNFDIHGGGVDLIFPHHTNEIAQSCCAYEGSFYAKYWVHNGFLTVDGEKMSKSAGNFILVNDLISSNISGEVIRYALISKHYHKPLNWTQKLLDDSAKAINSLKKIVLTIDQTEQDYDKKFIESLTDDLNTPAALARLFAIVADYNKSETEQQKNLHANKIASACSLLGFKFSKTVNDDQSRKIEELINQRTKAKQEKNWQEADKIRETLKEMGVSVEDNKDGSTLWFKK